MKHGWNDLNNYLAAHDRVLNNYTWVTPPQYQFIGVTTLAFELKITQATLITQNSNSVFVKIEKLAEIDDSYAHKRVRTVDYTYHAWDVQNKRNLLRYDSPHDHRPYHHKHVYDVSGKDTVTKIGNDEWPHVSDFLDEVSQSF